MKSKILPIFFVCLLFSCKKDLDLVKNNLVGNWNWKISHGKGSGEISYSAVPNGTRPTLISFNSNGTFENKSACLLPGPTQGEYEVQIFSYPGNIKSKVLILKSGTLQDTFTLEILGKQMILSERQQRVYWHVHEFTKE